METETAELDALRSVVRHWHDALVLRGPEACDMREWSDIDWRDSGWSNAEAAAIRKALGNAD